MADQPISFGKSPEEVAMRLFDTITSYDADCKLNNMDKDGILQLYTECVLAVKFPKGHGRP